MQGFAFLIKTQLPWCSNCIKQGDYGRYINCSPSRNLDLRNQCCSRQYNTIKHERHSMCHDLPHKEEAVYHIHLLPYTHFLHMHQPTNQHKRLIIYYYYHCHTCLTCTSIIKRSNLISQNLRNHFPKEIGRATRPPMLLISVRFIGARQLIFHLKLKHLYIKISISFRRMYMQIPLLSQGTKISSL